MNNAQRKAIVLGALIVALMGLYPPWVHHPYGVRTKPSPPGMIRIPAMIQVHYVYAPFFNPPKQGAVRLNTGRLLFQCVLVMILTGLAVMILDRY